MYQKFTSCNWRQAVGLKYRGKFESRKKTDYCCLTVSKNVLFVCLGGLQPSQQRGHVEPVS